MAESAGLWLQFRAGMKTGGNGGSCAQRNRGERENGAEYSARVTGEWSVTEERRFIKMSEKNGNKKDRAVTEKVNANQMKEHQTKAEQISTEYRAVYPSPVGLLTLTASDDALKSLAFEKERYPRIPEKGTRITVVQEPSGVLAEAFRWLDLYFSGQPPDFTPPLAPEGSEFRRLVWEELLKIPYGKTVTYGAIAGAVAEKKGLKRMSAQAVGGAVGHNPIGIIIPCHRVVGSGGNLTGFGGGIRAKTELLRLEGADMKSFYVPKKGTAL